MVSAHARLRDRIEPGVRVLFVGINPGLRSAATGHHFAGYSNRFWKLLYESGLVDEPITYEQDDRLPQWGFGITNIVPRATAGIDELTPEDYRTGAAALLRKIRRYRPQVVALVGVTVWRALLEALGETAFRRQPVDTRLPESHDRRRARLRASQSQRPQRHTDLSADADRVSHTGGREGLPCVRLGAHS